MSQIIKHEKEESACHQCSNRSTIIEKYTKLVDLLKHKVKKYENSKIKESIHTEFLEDNLTSIKSESYLKLALTVGKIALSKIRSTFQDLKQKDNITALPFFVIKRILNKNLKFSFIQISKYQQKQTISPTVNMSQKILQICVENANKNNQILSSKMLKPHKQLYKMIFNLQCANKIYQKQNCLLKTQIQEAFRRQQKQIFKKRQTLEMLVEQLSEKNEIIEDLKNIIKRYELKFETNKIKLRQNMLQEDSQGLKKVVDRLQHINDKLNLDLQKIKKEKCYFETQFNQSVKVNFDLKNEIKRLKQQNFDLHELNIQTLSLKKQLQIMSNKLNLKIQKMKKIQKKYCEFNRGKDSLSTGLFENILESKSQKKIENTQNFMLQRSASLREVQIQTKLESILTFLFHIEDEVYKIQSPELFDEDEKQLLAKHKQKFLQSVRFKLAPVVQKINVKQFQKNDQVQVYQNINNFDLSFLADLTNREEKKTQECHNINNLKLMQVQIEKCKLIERISQLKQKHMHIRSIILSLLKSFELKSIKKDTQGILAILFDIFQYSESQRASIFSTKSKKIFGFI